MVAPAATRVLGDVISEVRSAFGDLDGVQLQDSDIIRWTNAAQRDIVSQNPMLETSADQTSTAGTYKYPLPTDVYELKSVGYDVYELTATDFYLFMKSHRPYLDTITGIPVVWAVYNNEIYLYPPPADAKTITIRYVKSPTNVVASSDLLSVPDRYFNAVVAYVKTRAYEMDEDINNQSTADTEYKTQIADLSHRESVIRGGFAVMRDPYYEDLEMAHWTLYGSY